MKRKALALFMCLVICASFVGNAFAAGSGPVLNIDAKAGEASFTFSATGIGGSDRTVPGNIAIKPADSTSPEGDSTDEKDKVATVNFTVKDGDIAEVSVSAAIDDHTALAANERVLVAVAGYTKEVTVEATVPHYITVNAKNATYAIKVGSDDYAETGVVAGKEVTITATPSEGYEFKTWAVTPDVTFAEGSGLTSNPVTFTMPDEDVKFTATVEQKSADTYTVTYDANGGTGTMDPVEVKKGSNHTLLTNSFTAPEGKEFNAWQVGEDTNEHAAGYSFPVNADVTVKAIWKDKTTPVDPTDDETFTVSFNANGGEGDMKSETVKKGGMYELPANGFTAPEGKEFDGWKVGDETRQPGETITVNGNVEVTAQWSDLPAEDEVKVTYKAGEGSTDADKTKNVKIGEPFQLPENMFTPKTGYVFLGWTDGENDYDVGDSYELTENVTFTAQWQDNSIHVRGVKILFEGEEVTELSMKTSTKTYQLTADVEPADASDPSVTWTSSKSRIVEVDNDGKLTPKKSGTATITVTTTDGEFTATCEVTVTGSSSGGGTRGGGSSGGGGGGSSSSDTINRGASLNGSYTVSNPTAKAGDKVTVTPKANTGYETDSVKVTDAKGNPVAVTKNADGTYSFTMPDADALPVRTEVTFKRADSTGTGAGTGTTAPSFTDVPADAYYADAVKWAVANGITNGIDSTHFGPENACTRAQFVTFLWRAAGSPEPESTDTDFTDLGATDSYYYKAVLWAVEQGITNGTGADTFSPNATVTRGQVVTFLFRFEKAAAGDENPFVDVDDDAYYADAVAWAVEEHITNGTSDTTFSPENNCTRGQIVTFLYRDMAD